MTKRTLFLIGILFECIAIFGVFVPYEILLSRGTPVTLRTVPIDPYSIFRGQYVILGYEAGNGYTSEKPIDSSVGYNYGKTVYVVLKEKDGIFERTRFSDEKPILADGEQCLRGRLEYQRVIFPDIAQYFVEEGLGREIENARNTHRLFVDAVLDANCSAVLRSVKIGPEVPANELQDSLFPLPGQVPVKPAPVSGR